VFRLEGDGSETTLHSFNAKDESSRPRALALGPDGKLYGATAGYYDNAPAIAYRISTAGAFELLHRFDRYIYSSAFTFGPDGAPYANGGSGGGGPWAAGAVYRLEPDGSVTTLYQLSFIHNAPYYAMGSLALAEGGWLYGVSNRGGDHDMGAIYRVNINGASQVVYSFHEMGNGIDGKTPTWGPTSGPDGTVFGTTPAGDSKGGSVWQIDPAGVFSTAHFLKLDGSEGMVRAEGVSARGHGAVFGATSEGGAGNEGTVYRLAPSGRLKVLHSFASSGLEGSGFKDAPVAGKNGEILGTTCSGGSGGQGTIYRITRN
jgi:uncharacterized repeat protein (TIGR03803 family)